MALQEMFAAQPNSPATELTAAITDVQTTVSVLDASKLPDAPNIATIGVDESAETVRYEGKSGNDLTGVTRGFSETTAKAWGIGVGVARYFTAYDADALRENVADVNTQLVDNNYKRVTTKSYEHLKEGDDWYPALLAAYNDTPVGGILFIHDMLSVSQTLVVSKAVTIITPHAEENPAKSSGLKKMANVPAMVIAERGVTLSNLHFTAAVLSGDISPLVTIGTDDVMAQNTIFENVYATSGDADGIELKNANNCKLDFSVIGNAGWGFITRPSAAGNYSGNTICCRNAYGNGVGVALSGEGNTFYVVSQSNVGDNIQLIGACSNNSLDGYTEYSINGYEIHAMGNVEAIGITGAYRNPDPTKIYKSETGFPNYLRFGWDLQNAPIGSKVNTFATRHFGHEFHLTYAGSDGLPVSLGKISLDESTNMIAFNDKPLAHQAKRELNFTASNIKPTVGDSGNLLFNDNFNNFSNGIPIRTDGLVSGLEVTIDQALTNDAVLVTILKNGSPVDNGVITYNSANPLSQYIDLSAFVIAGDVITVRANWFNNTAPLNIRANARVFII